MGRLKKIGVALLGILAILITLSLASHFYISAKKAGADERLQEAYARKSFTPGELREDIAYFRYLLEQVHPPVIVSFPLGDHEPALTELAESLDQPHTQLSFYRQLAPVGNLLNDEHTMVFSPERDLPGNHEPTVALFPFDVQFVDSRLYVARNLSDEADIQPGMEIISINGLPVEELRATLKTYYSGTRDEQKLFYVQENFPDALYSILGSGDSFELLIRDSLRGEDNSYLVSGKERAKFGQKEFHYEVIFPDTILFIYNAFKDENDEFTYFLQEMFATAEQQDIRNLIIDIRRNQGGASAYGDEILAYLLSEPFSQMTHVEVTVSEAVKENFISYVPAFIRWFPVQYFHPLLRSLWTSELGETATVSFKSVNLRDKASRFTGDVYLLIGPGTMSSASLFAATFQEYNAGTLIGEETGGYATLYGNVVDAYLPNTGLRVWMPTSVVYGNSTGPVVPEHIVTQTVPDLLEQRDTVLEFARELTRSR